MKLQTELSLLDMVRMFIADGHGTLALVYTIKLVRSCR
jgi:hypothetical protein